MRAIGALVVTEVIFAICAVVFAYRSRRNVGARMVWLVWVFCALAVASFLAAGWIAVVTHD